MATTKELLQSLEKAIGKLKEAQHFPDTEAHRESTIQRFEYTFEISWKLMSSFLKDEGFDYQGVRTIIRAAAKHGLILEPGKWLGFQDARNMTSHAYHEELAERVYEVARSDFVLNAQTLADEIKKRVFLP